LGFLCMLCIRNEEILGTASFSALYLNIGQIMDLSNYPAREYDDGKLPL
jgi:hypothetical protein